MQWIKPVTLLGQHVILKPLDESHHVELSEAVQDGELWKLWYTFIPSPENMLAEIQRRLALQQQGQMPPPPPPPQPARHILKITARLNRVLFIDRKSTRLNSSHT